MMIIKKLRQAAGLAAVIAASMSPLLTNAGQYCHVEINDVWYELTSDNEAHVISKFFKSHTHYPEDYDLVIPPTVEYEGEIYTVTELKDYEEHIGHSQYHVHVALDNEPIATLSLPSTMTDLGSLTHVYLPRLTAITVEPGNKYFESIDGVLYDTEEKKTLLLYPRLKPVTSFDIPEGVVRLGYQSLVGQNLTHVNFPSTLRGIGGRALAGLKLDEINLNEGLEAIGEYAFSGVTYHKPLVIPESVKDLSDYCFGSTEIENIVLPSWVVEIGVGWFKNSFTETIPVPERITRIGEYAFADSWIKHMDLPDGIQAIEFCAFACCDSLREIRLPLELSTLEDHIFFDCENLKRVTLNKNIKRVKAAFDDCPSLSDLYMLPERPPRLDEECPLGYRDPEYFINRLGQITVHVPEGCGEAYRNSTWAKVGPIVEDLNSGVGDLPAGGPIASEEACTAYTLQGTVAGEGIPYGKLREALSSGIYIIRTASGKTDKIRL